VGGRPGEDRPQQRHRGRSDQGRAGALSEPGHEQRGVTGRERRGGRRDAEHQQSRRERPASAVPVREPPAEQQQTGEREPVCGTEQDQLLAPQPEFVPDVRQRHGHGSQREDQRHLHGAEQRERRLGGAG
jgi:hypothetical protein